MEESESGTFQTELNHSISFDKKQFPYCVDEVRLPASINAVALREAFLSEAPFVTPSNRSFWRKMVDGENFRNLLAASYYYIAECVSDSGVVQLDKLQDYASSPMASKMSTNLAELYYSPELRTYDYFFLRMPEVLAFMLICALRTSTPKHHRLCQTAKFREILLDWCCEIIGGIRFANCRTNREWFFHEALDSNILTATNESATPQPSSPNKSTRANDSYALSKYKIGLSPLIEMYTAGRTNALRPDFNVKLSMSHSTSRSICSMRPSNQISDSKIRPHRIDYTTLPDILKRTTTNRKQILVDYKKDMKDSEKDVRKMTKKLKLHLKVLSETSSKNINLEKLTNQS